MSKNLRAADVPRVRQNEAAGAVKLAKTVGACAHGASIALSGTSAAVRCRVMTCSLFLSALLLATPLHAAKRDVLADLPHERVDFWVASFSKQHDYHKKIAAGFERKAKYPGGRAGG